MSVLPGCMMPDGADPCDGYKQLARVEEFLKRRNEKLREYLEEMQHRSEAHDAEVAAKTLEEAAIKCEARADAFQKSEGFKYSENQTNAESGLRNFSYELEAMAAEYRAGR